MKHFVTAAFAAGLFWLAAERSVTTAVAGLAFAVVYWGVRIEDDIKRQKPPEDINKGWGDF